ncbi:MAG TPA: Flp family type IVb pilin [Terracidiphilus sp.]|nr:Flp family type IVb pilin [Terracidiphilus sp.]
MGLVTWNIRFALRALLAEEEGQDLVEYAIIAALMALGAVSGMQSVGSAVAGIFDRLSAILFVALG